MNTYQRLVLVLLSGLTVGALSAAPNAGAAIGFPASRITAESWNPLRETMESMKIEAGSTRKSVLSLLGTPAQELAPDVYLYDNCRPDQEIAVSKGCNTLIITFKQNRVSDMKFVNSRASTVIASNLRNSSPEHRGSGSSPAPTKGFAQPPQ